MERPTHLDLSPPAALVRAIEQTPGCNIRIPKEIDPQTVINMMTTVREAEKFTRY